MNEASLVRVGVGGRWFRVPLGIDLLFIKSVCGRIGHHLLLALVQFSSYSVKPLPRYYSIEVEVDTENHNLENFSHLMT